MNTIPPIHAYDLDEGIGAKIKYTLDGGRLPRFSPHDEIQRNVWKLL